jgi:hypothetical protein
MSNHFLFTFYKGSSVNKSILQIGWMAVVLVSVGGPLTIWAMRGTAIHEATPPPASVQAVDPSQQQAANQALAELRTAQAAKERLELEEKNLAAAKALAEEQQAQNEKTASHLAGWYGRQMMTGTFDGGQNLSVKYGDWSVTGNRFTIDITVTFDGNFDSTHFYEVDGTLMINSDGSNPVFQRTHANDTANSYLLTKAIIDAAANSK